MLDRILHVWRLIAYVPLRLALPLGGEATRRDILRQIQPRLDRPLPGSITSGQLAEALSHPSLRSIFYYRLRHRGGWARVASIVLKRIYQGELGLIFGVDEMGPGLLMMHGTASLIGAKRIGIDCQLAQHMTMGYDDRGGPPTLGDRVRVGAGAIILGPITIGDDAVVGAGAVVVKDVPAGAVVGGVPARVIENASNRFAAGKREGAPGTDGVAAERQEGTESPP